MDLVVFFVLRELKNYRSIDWFSSSNAFENINRKLPKSINFEKSFMNQMKVLIVDDNPKVRTLVRDYLPNSVDEIYECSDGIEAFESYEKHLPDWVLMDWEMEEMDGVTAIRQIVDEYPTAHICMVTAYDDEDLKKEAFQAGASGFVLKDNLFELKEMFRVTN